MEHIPVLLDPILQMAKGLSQPPAHYLDGTFGRGGHTRALMAEFPQMRTFALDQDEEAIAYGQEHFQRELASGHLVLCRANFREVESLQERFSEFHGGAGFDLILLDLGVSSPQLDRGDRGFSFYHDGPLDMRMDQRGEVTAEDIINNWNPDELSDLFRELGEVRSPGRVVNAIIEERRKQAFRTTRELASLIERCLGWRKKGHHPATQYFLALRLEVNRELDVVKEVIPQLVELLRDSGRLMIITFHSLEDRIVKYALRDLCDRGFLVNKKVIQAPWGEAKKNPRARSAKLRVFQKGELP
ncbi:MAG: 16S rRNA (cytosine(1402)-N(4))-methyltransferase RsmH [Bdellovibrionaceae bacterium]|nr:16S rRNA (cytosine(1402)-N(4))-methyltransferase RsmH [Bdellovibrionales bacterium]MCB9084791.1 16S rRNA (cytosine(1402)-N(4))-methyltransferase RsmH [Pseudobdellovibrionaceae bacterium]